MSQGKIFFTGPFGAGKTSAIRSISDVPPVKKDVAACDMTKSRNSATTVAMDYGVMDLGGGEKIHLYGTQGQEHLDFIPDILTTDMIGLILLLDNSRADPLQDMIYFLDSFSQFISETSVAIGVTQMDRSNKPTIEDYHNQLVGGELRPPVFSVDAREKNDVSLLVQALLYSIDPGIEGE